VTPELLALGNRLRGLEREYRAHRADCVVCLSAAPCDDMNHILDELWKARAAFWAEWDRVTTTEVKTMP